VVFWSVVITANAYYYYQKNRQIDKDNAKLQIQLLNARLSLLHAQLEPHFMFNVLNTLSFLVKLNQQDTAIKGINQLSKVLRYIIEVSDKQVVAFTKEREFTQLYIQLQQLRFEEKLQVKFNCSTLLEEDMVPIMLFQPLIENAIKFGELADSKCCKITINCKKTFTHILITVENKVAKIQGLKSTGTGLKNLKFRLKSLYQGNFKIKQGLKDNIFNITIQLPIISQQEQESEV
jgi:LytS/YehU family sensor histidine kinase